MHLKRFLAYWFCSVLDYSKAIHKVSVKETQTNKYAENHKNAVTKLKDFSRGAFLELVASLSFGSGAMGS